MNYSLKVTLLTILKVEFGPYSKVKFEGQLCDIIALPY